MSYYRTLELCLSEIKRCQFFIGILGSRYGYVPNKYDVPDTQEYQWLKTYPAGASVTELEMHSGALCEPGKLGRNAFFFIRDPSFEKYVMKPMKLLTISWENVACKSRYCLKN